MIAKRFVTIGVVVVFVGALRALEAADVEEALGDCLAAAVAATLLTWAIAP